MLTHVSSIDCFTMSTHGVPLENLLDHAVLLGLRLDGVWGCRGGGWGGSGRGVLIDNGRVYQSKAADALVPVKTTKFGTNVGLSMLLNISSRYFGGLFWSRQLRGLPSSDGYFFFKSIPQLVINSPMTATRLGSTPNLWAFSRKCLVATSQSWKAAGYGCSGARR